MWRRLLAFAVTLVSLFASSRASAWYFPEHVVLMGDGHAALAPEIRAIIGDTVAAARREGLVLCDRSDLSLEEVLRDSPLATAMIRTPASVACIPYVALPGLAGDHASDIDELRTVLTTNKGIELVSTVAYEWRRFRTNTLRGQSSLDRMSFVHDLDVALYFIDSGYVTRARATRVHFRDVGRSFDDVLRDLAVQGRIDDLLGRFVFHHLRSLILAASGKRVDALLEHAFAIHFLEDGFASGHLVMSDASWARGRDAVRLRHDAFNTEGLLVTRAMSREPCSSLATGTLELAGLPPCWTTTGDGYLGLTSDAADRLHVAAALSRAELAFATALDPERVQRYADGLGELALVTLATKLDPTPWWTVDPDMRRSLPAGPKHAMRLVRNATASVAKLRDMPLSPAAGVDVTRIAGAVPASVIAAARAAPHITSEGAPDDDAADAGAADANPGTTLLLPTLAQMPAAQSDTAKQDPLGHLDHGWAVQVFVASGAMVLVPPSSPVDFFGPGVGASAGLSYRWGSLLPGRRARSIAEFNVGISETLHIDTRGDSGGGARLTMLDQELRWPVVWEALTTYTLPLDLVSMHRAGRVLFFNGIRAHEVLREGSLAFLGMELEAFAIALSDGYGSHPLYAVSPELRFYVGAANPSAAQPSFPGTLGVTVGITLTGGYATFL
ncbi:MAG: hypothetical protein JWP87_137 [Labilithrix sp.]|nr:hypothetical protein [Labilithrix sp.]